MGASADLNHTSIAPGCNLHHTCVQPTPGTKKPGMTGRTLRRAGTSCNPLRAVRAAQIGVVSEFGK